MNESITQKIFSPMATGNGAYIIHRLLAEKISTYHLFSYNPYLTLFPPLLPFLGRENDKPSIIHTTPDYALFFKRQGIPLVITFHNYVLDHFMMPYSTVMQRLHYKTNLRLFTKLALSAASVVTSVSRFTAELVQKETGFEGAVKVIYNGIDTQLFYPKKRTAQKKIKVLFSGNLTKRKGAELLPFIAQKLDKNIEILYTSGLRTKNRLTSASNMQNLGPVPYSIMPTVYQEADILLFPTVREGFGLAAAEAMACGLPVVATNCSSLPELVVHGEGGYLCELANVDDFANRINELASSLSLRQEMGEHNRARVEKKFSLDRMIREYRELFERVTSY